ncbi:hypothetical protein HJC23_007270 [Cyclotella cryptica]|uniref:Actin-like ATPase domain-containing protein n=1 Tax=Cyclotella cryptica TaxID=29204 RepID=A0ABD3Q5H1_9STRA|eukprot:CCRYP_010074-RA/>CCRYP_010074-RA protein AED:0.37 eAED:0.37 QI:0/-1/0/1/-1/1/1/0/458
MTSYHQTVVVELGSSRIKIGFAGESRPRRVLHGDVWDSDDGCSWSVPINDGVGARPCTWGKFFRYFSMNSSHSSAASKVSSVYEWEQTIYPLFSHILTSVLFVQRPSRHRILIVTNDLYPPRNFREALIRVLLNYLGVGGVLIVNGGAFAGISYLLEGLPPSIDLSPPKAYLLVDIGTYEARVLVLVTGSSILAETNQTVMSGYHSFLRQLLNNYQEHHVETDEPDSTAIITTLQDANSIVQAWLSISRESKDVTTLSVRLPSDSSQTPVRLSIGPMQEAFRQVYLDYTNPSSLVFAMLSSLIDCPIDYRRVALQNVVLLGGGSTALRYFTYTSNKAKSGYKLGDALIKAAVDACGIINESSEISDEKKEDESVTISSISKHRFKCLQPSILGRVDESGEYRGGMTLRYPDPFAADVASWIGGSIMGSLDLKNEEWLLKKCDSDNIDVRASSHRANAR